MPLMKVVVVGLLLAASAVVGFYAVERYLADPNAEKLLSSFDDQILTFARRSGSEYRFAQGWEQGGWGAWMRGNEARVVLDGDGAPTADADLHLIGRVELAQGQASHTVALSLNGQPLGHWLLAASQATTELHLRVPKETFAGQVPVLEFSTTSATNARFGMKSLALVDGARLERFQGSFDVCSARSVEGWAVADGSPTSVRVMSEGQAVTGQWTAMPRPDLNAGGLPDNAGFRFRPSKPFTVGAEIALYFLNGRIVSGSPCVVQ